MEKQIVQCYTDNTYTEKEFHLTPFQLVFNQDGKNLKEVIQESDCDFVETKNSEIEKVLDLSEKRENFIEHARIILGQQGTVIWEDIYGKYHYENDSKFLGQANKPGTIFNQTWKRILSGNLSEVINFNYFYKDRNKYDRYVFPKFTITNTCKNMDHAFEGITFNPFSDDIIKNTWDTSNVISMDYLFKDANITEPVLLYSEDVGKWNLKQVSSCRGFFENASIKTVIGIDLGLFTFGSQTCMEKFFANSNIPTIYIYGQLIYDLHRYDGIFDNTPNLTTLRFEQNSIYGNLDVSQTGLTTADKLMNVAYGLSESAHGEYTLIIPAAARQDVYYQYEWGVRNHLTEETFQGIVESKQWVLVYGL